MTIRPRFDTFWRDDGCRIHLIDDEQGLRLAAEGGRSPGRFHVTLQEGSNTRGLPAIVRIVVDLDGDGNGEVRLPAFVRELLDRPYYVIVHDGSA